MGLDVSNHYQGDDIMILITSNKDTPSHIVYHELILTSKAPTRMLLGDRSMEKVLARSLPCLGSDTSPYVLHQPDAGNLSRAQSWTNIFEGGSSLELIFE